MDEKILKLAEEFGQAIADHERVKALRDASAAFEKDEDAQSLRKQYDEIVATIQEGLAGGRPVEPEEKRKEADLRAEVARNDKISALVHAQADFHALMNAVNEMVRKSIGL